MFCKARYISYWASTAKSFIQRRDLSHSAPALSIPSPRDWRTEGHPAPRSLLDDSDEPVDLSEDLSSPASPSSVYTSPAKPYRRKPSKIPTPADKRTHTDTMRKNFPDGWSPPRKLSREAMDGLRSLYAHDPETFSTPVLADRFCISPEAVRRILKSKWAPSREAQVRIARREREVREEAVRARRTESRMREAEALQANMARYDGVLKKKQKFASTSSSSSGKLDDEATTTVGTNSLDNSKGGRKRRSKPKDELFFQ